MMSIEPKRVTLLERDTMQLLLRAARRKNDWKLVDAAIAFFSGNVDDGVLCAVAEAVYDKAIVDIVEAIPTETLIELRSDSLRRAYLEMHVLEPINPIIVALVRGSDSLEGLLDEDEGELALWGKDTFFEEIEALMTSKRLLLPIDFEWKTPHVSAGTSSISLDELGCVPPRYRHLTLSTQAAAAVRELIEEIASIYDLPGNGENDESPR